MSERGRIFVPGIAFCPVDSSESWWTERFEGKRDQPSPWPTDWFLGYIDLPPGEQHTLLASVPPEHIGGLLRRLRFDCDASSAVQITSLRLGGVECLDLDKPRVLPHGHLDLHLRSPGIGVAISLRNTDTVYHTVAVRGKFASIEDILRADAAVGMVSKDQTNALGYKDLGPGESGSISGPIWVDPMSFVRNPGNPRLVATIVQALFVDVKTDATWPVATRQNVLERITIDRIQVDGNNVPMVMPYPYMHNSTSIVERPLDRPLLMSGQSQITVTIRNHNIERHFVGVGLLRDDLVESPEYRKTCADFTDVKGRVLESSWGPRYDTKEGPLYGPLAAVARRME